MAAVAVAGQGTYPNLAAPADDAAGKVVMLANLVSALEAEGTSAIKTTWWRDVLQQALDWTLTTT